MELPLAVFGAGLLGALSLLAVAVRRARRRDAALRAFAGRQGWAFTPRDDVWARGLDGVPFRTGTGRRCESVLTGTHRDRDLVAFDYSYRTTSTDANGQATQQVHRYAVALLRLPAPLPRVELHPSRLPRLFARGLEFESDAFNARYRVRADDPRTAYDVLPPRTLQLLLDRPDLSLRLHAGCAVSWRPGLLQPEELLARLDTMSGVLDGVPGFVWADRS